MAMTLLLFALGLVVLAAAGELLIRCSSRLATDLGVSRLFIGITVVAFGTSAPEAVVSVVAAIGGQSDPALGNVVGSSIFNGLLILGLASLIIPLSVSSQLVRFDLPFLVFVSGICFAFCLDGSVSLPDGLILLCLLAAHLLFSYRMGLRSARAGRDSRASSILPGAKSEFPRALAPWGGRALNAVLVVASFGFLVLGSRLLVTSAATMARWLGLSELVIGLTVVAAGTSLPEVATSVMAAIRGERDLAVGNVIGSNIFNILGVLGVSATLAPGGVDVSPALLAFDLPVMLAVTVLLIPIFFTGMQISRWEGALLLGYFVLYNAYLLLRTTGNDFTHGLPWIISWVVLPLTIATVLGVSISGVVSRRRCTRIHP